MIDRRVLVAGIGNIFLGDDGWGVAVVNRLAGECIPDGVRVGDYGIRGVHLAYELLDGYDALVLVDAMSMGDEPGTVAAVEAEIPNVSNDVGADRPDENGPVVDAHSMNPATVLMLAGHLGATVDRIVVVGCEPATLDEGIGLSEVAEAAVGAGVELCREVIAELTATPRMKETVT